MGDHGSSERQRLILCPATTILKSRTCGKLLHLCWFSTGQDLSTSSLCNLAAPHIQDIHIFRSLGTNLGSDIGGDAEVKGICLCKRWTRHAQSRYAWLESRVNIVNAYGFSSTMCMCYSEFVVCILLQTIVPHWYISYHICPSPGCLCVLYTRIFSWSHQWRGWLDWGKYGMSAAEHRRCCTSFLWRLHRETGVH